MPFTAGAGQMIKGFDAAVIGMKVGEKKTIKLLPQDAYGEYKGGLVIGVPKEDLTSQGIEPKVGMKLNTAAGRVMITEVTADRVTLDANHELAGKTLIFDITLVSIS